MAAEPSRSAASADSYIGSLINLTSKYEIRYEGILHNINTEESSIGLRNVRTFGTEGRKKDGQQIPPSDKIYEYILFRGSDIKDLQVKSSPPVQTVPPIHNDPAIIQSHYSRPAAPASIPTTLPSVGIGTIADLGSHTVQVGAPRSTFQSGLPLYQPGGSLGSWGSSPPPPTANGSGLAMPMYWQGFYAAPGGVPHLLQPPLLRPPGPPSGLPIPHSMQQPLQYPGMNPSLPSGSQNLPGAHTSLPSRSPNLSGMTASFPSSSSNLPGMHASFLSPSPNLPGISSSLPSGPSNLPGISSSLPSGPSNLPEISASLPTESPNLHGTNVLLPSGSLNLPEFPPPLLPPVSSNHSLISTTLPASTQATSLTPDAPASLLPNKSPLTSLPAATHNANLPFVSPSTSSLDSIVAPVSSKSRIISCAELVYQTISQSMPSVIGSSSSIQADKSAPSILMPGQLLQFGPSTICSQPVQSGLKAAEVKLTSSEPPKQASTDSKEPILPLPTPLDQKQNGAAFHTHHFTRGRGRGRGNVYSRPVTKFTEDFDFTAMNEKFKKDEVWGHLGKSKTQLRDKEGDANEDDYDDTQEEEEAESSKFEMKPVYVKDDFFDSLSCNALDRGARNGRTKFSEQLKIDTETFGDFPRHRPGRGGGRGFRGGGSTRGPYYGRGYGYVGRGRGQTWPNRAM